MDRPSGEVNIIPEATNDPGVSWHKYDNCKLLINSQNVLASATLDNRERLPFQMENFGHPADCGRNLRRLCVEYVSYSPQDRMEAGRGARRSIG